MAHVVWINKHAPMPEWLRDPDRELTHNGNVGKAAKVYVSYRYWIKVWHATPLWATRDPIAEIYNEAARRRAAGEDVVVDHMVPLAHPRVCGLHWHGNLEIINRYGNAVKSNHWWPDCPNDDPNIEQLELL